MLKGEIWELILLCLLSVKDLVSLAAVCTSIRAECKRFQPRELGIDAVDIEVERHELLFVRRLVAEQRHAQLRTVLFFRQDPPSLNLAWCTVLGLMPSLTALRGIGWDAGGHWHGYKLLPCSLTRLTFADQPAGALCDPVEPNLRLLQPFTRLQKLKLPIHDLVVEWVPPSVHTLHIPYIRDSGAPLHEGIVELHIHEVSSWEQLEQILQLPSLKRLHIVDIVDIAAMPDCLVRFCNLETLVIPASPSWQYVDCKYVSDPMHHGIPLN
jgi:hypothetical protein